MKKLLILIAMVFVINTMAYGGECDYIEYVAPEINYNIKEANVNVNFSGGAISDTVFCNGRLCVPLIEGVKVMNAQIVSIGTGYRISCEGEKTFVNSIITSNRPYIFTYNNKEYISVYELINPFGYGLVADLNNNSAQVLKSEFDSSEILISQNNSKEAYIRLEDIVADGLKPGTKGNYTVDMLEKLKFTAEYLYNNNQEYYIAWIPVYASPADNYWNDVSQEYNFYNSYFLYVIDYMVDHNGHLGLHGYTHQYGNDESAIGYEWGEDTPYNEYEQQRRMVAAKENCHKLGYNDEFFEFPHYGATDAQMRMAEYYFDAIYQPYPENNLYNYITYTTRSGKMVYYIPTPADYVHFKRDSSIFDRIKSSVDNGYTLSLFYHPVIDENQFNAETVNGVRKWTYSQGGSLPEILSYITKLGFKFSNFK